MRRALALGLAAFGLCARLLAAAVPSPESVLGFKVGEDRKLADWNQIVDYFHRLAAASDRVSVEEVGKTTEGRPFLVVTITSEANRARLEEIRRANLRLADPRGLAPEEALRIVREGKTIVALNHGIHSTEVGAYQTPLETAYWLASSQDPEVLEILDRTVVLMLPSHNPDGAQRVVEWYRKSLGTAWEGEDVPFLYHHYVGHDDNRDWYMFTQQESRLTVRFVYDRWRPQIVHDLHQMGRKGARIFVPPYTDPWEPNVDAALVAATSALGTHMAARLLAEGKTGVVVNALFDGWTPARSYPHTHGGVRILSELASARMATPLELPFDELEKGSGFDVKAPSWNFPAPWPGGTWRLRDIVDYELSATRALLGHAARNHEYWLQTSYDVNRRAATRTDLYAFVFPAEQKDPLAASRLLEVMRLGSVEVHRAKAPFAAEGRSFAAGSHVILMKQPFSSFAKQLLERQRYPDLRLYPGGPPLRPYDVTAHTLPLLMGVEAVAVAAPFEAELEPVADTAVAPGRIEGGGRFFAIGHKNGELVALGRLLRAEVPVRWATHAFDDGGRRFAAGTLLVPRSARGRLEPIVRELGLLARAVGSAPPALRLRKPRVGLYQSWVASMDEGWTRFVLEKELGVDYVTLHDGDVRGGGLRKRFDAIVLPDQSSGQILNGHAHGSLPEEYTGGLGRDGAARLAEFVKEGGTLIALDTASLFTIDELGLPVENGLAGFKRRVRGEEKEEETGADFYCPGAILKTQVEGDNPLAHGLEPETPVWFESSPAFETTAGAVVLRYPAANPLLSGWLLGDANLHGKAALVEVPRGRGRVVLFGFRPQYRAQSWATYIALANALYLSAAARLP
jgi:Zinc carboxypeptidase